MAVPVPDATGKVVAAISIAMLQDRLDRERVRALADIMRAHVAQVTIRLKELEAARQVGRR